MSGNKKVWSVMYHYGEGAERTIAAAWPTRKDAENSRKVFMERSPAHTAWIVETEIPESPTPEQTHVDVYTVQWLSPYGSHCETAFRTFSSLAAAKNYTNSHHSPNSCTITKRTEEIVR